jgi:hypothetical protein
MQSVNARPFVKSENDDDEDDWVEVEENNFCIEDG